MSTARKPSPQPAAQQTEARLDTLFAALVERFMEIASVRAILAELIIFERECVEFIADDWSKLFATVEAVLEASHREEGRSPDLAAAMTRIVRRCVHAVEAVPNGRKFLAAAYPVAREVAETVEQIVRIWLLLLEDAAPADEKTGTRVLVSNRLGDSMCPSHTSQALSASLDDMLSTTVVPFQEMVRVLQKVYATIEGDLPPECVAYLEEKGISVRVIH